MKEILIFSAGPAGRETFQLINSINRSKKEWKVIGYVDDNLSKNVRSIMKNIIIQNAINTNFPNSNCVTSSLYDFADK